MLAHASGTASFFKTLAPVLIADVLTVPFVDSFVKVREAHDAPLHPLVATQLYRKG